MNIDWDGLESLVLLNPRMHKRFDPLAIYRMLPSFEGHIWIATSGTSSSDTLKLVALSKRSILLAAQAANDHLRATSKDIWLNILPTFHVGGLSIFARAHLLGCNVVLSEEGWEPMRFIVNLESSRATLTSLVPTQIFDLVIRDLKPPESLRAVVVGGGAVSAKLYERARDLGWPLLPSYGLTECCSQVATAPLSSLDSLEEPHLTRLNHVKLHTNGEGRLMISSEALLSAYAFVKEESVEIFDPKDAGWFVTEDLAELNGDVIQLKGRSDDRVKVLGELVDVFDLNHRFMTLVHEQNQTLDCQLMANVSDREGSQIDLVCQIEGLERVLPLVERFNKTVAGPERIHNIYFVPELVRTTLGKVHQAQVRKDIGF